MLSFIEQLSNKCSFVNQNTIFEKHKVKDLDDISRFSLSQLPMIIVEYRKFDIRQKKIFDILFKNFV